MWLDGMSQSDKDEMYLDASTAFNTGVIDEKEYRRTLAHLGYNATDINDAVRQHEPNIP